MAMNDFLTALALAIVIEGVAYALFPDAMKQMMLRAMAMPASMLRLAGLAAAVFGVMMVGLVRIAYFSQ